MDRRNFLARLGVGTAVAITAPRILLPKEKVFDPEITIPGDALDIPMMDGSYLMWNDRPIMHIADCKINYKYPQINITQIGDPYPEYMQGLPEVDIGMTGLANKLLQEAFGASELVSLYVKNKKENTAYTCDGYISEIIFPSDKIDIGPLWGERYAFAEVRFELSGALMGHKI